MKEYLRIEEVAEILQVDKRTIYRLLNEIDEKKRLTGVRVGGQLRISRTHLNEYMERNELKPEV